MDVTIFGIDLYLDPVAFSIGGKWTIYWYGIIIAVGFALESAFHDLSVGVQTVGVVAHL